ncbi:hypothetical protein WISP_81406 [Willisornis vidua]|uniref:Uncharacterized protein n=1 Tax=Willisornis vidua TaxID=1566151 RepID=A0ABQ9D4F8_9PASS|nr:hypothetical protein WISP_81406 [Willisornis vidua]
MPGASSQQKLSTEGEGKGSKNLTSSQLESISAMGKQAPSLRDENTGPGECCIRGWSALTPFKAVSNSHILQAKQLKLIQNVLGGCCGDQVPYPSGEEIFTITGHIVWFDSSHAASDGSAVLFYSNFTFLPLFSNRSVITA